MRLNPFVLLVVLSVACPGKPRPPAPPLVVEQVHRCLTEPPPEPPGVHFSGPSEGCPPQFDACLAPADAATLETFIRDLRRWADQAWLACRPEETP